MSWCCIIFLIFHHVYLSAINRQGILNMEYSASAQVSTFIFSLVNDMGIHFSKFTRYFLNHLRSIISWGKCMSLKNSNMNTKRFWLHCKQFITMPPGMLRYYLARNSHTNTVFYVSQLVAFLKTGSENRPKCKVIHT